MAAKSPDECDCSTFRNIELLVEEEAIQTHDNAPHRLEPEISYESLWVSDCLACFGLCDIQPDAGPSLLC